MNDLDLIIQQLAHENTRIRVQAVRTLGNVGDKTLLPVLANMFNDKSVAVVRTATLAIGKIGDCDALAILLPLVEHEDLWIRKATVQAIGLTECQDAVPILVNLLEDKYLHDLVREALIALKVDPDFF